MGNDGTNSRAVLFKSVSGTNCLAVVLRSVLPNKAGESPGEEPGAVLDDPGKLPNAAPLAYVPPEEAMSG